MLLLGLLLLLLLRERERALEQALVQVLLGPHGVLEAAGGGVL